MKQNSCNEFMNQNRRNELMKHHYGYFMQQNRRNEFMKQNYGYFTIIANILNLSKFEFSCG